MTSQAKKFLKAYRKANLGYAHFSMILSSTSDFKGSVDYYHGSDFTLLLEAQNVGLIEITESKVRLTEEGKVYFDSSDSIYQEILDDLNEKRSSIRPTLSGVRLTDMVKKKIRPWLNDYTVNDFKLVHAYVADEVKNGNYDLKYFNPDTIYKKGEKGVTFDTRFINAQAWADRHSVNDFSFEQL